MDDHAKRGQNGAENIESELNEPGGDGTADADNESRASQGAADTSNAVRGLVEQVLEEGLSRVKGESGKLGSRASQTVSGMLSEFGVAQRRDHEDLELRIAQLEHRVRLLEGQLDADGEAASSPTDAAEDS